MVNKVVIVGAGVSGLFASYLLLKDGAQVQLFDQSTAAGKKILVAGHGGFNLTHSENLESFSGRYDAHKQRFEHYLKVFSPTDLRKFLSLLGVETYVGSSGRVFPKEMTAAGFLIAFMKLLKSYAGFQFFPNMSFKGLGKKRNPYLLKFLDLKKQRVNSETSVEASMVIFCLGGKSWKKTGSDGIWREILTEEGIIVSELEAFNCGYEISWSDEFKKKIDSLPLKNIAVTCDGRRVRSECMLTRYGIEGGAIYALSSELLRLRQRELDLLISLDLCPDLTTDKILQKLSKPRGKNSWSNFLRKALGVNKTTLTLLREVLPKKEFQSHEILASKIKNLIIQLERPRDIDEAISTAGGVCFEGLTPELMAKTHPGVYFCGEMLDWQAPTGGYLIQGCFSTAKVVCEDILKKN